MTSEDVLLKVAGLRKWFPIRTGLFESILSRQTSYVYAVDGISFKIHTGEIFGLAGESGCGKTTTGKLVLGLMRPTSGAVLFEGREIFSLKKHELKRLRREMHMIYQDPYESLNPRMRVYDIVAEPLSAQKIVDTASDEEEKVSQALEVVELEPSRDFFFRYPHELSGGQRQRVSIARALVLNPKLIVADEPVSMLDVSIRAEILNLLLSLKREFGLSYLLITHDLALARHFCDSIAIMYLGRIVEMAPMEEVLKEPLHPYTRALIAAVPIADPLAKRATTAISGEVPNPLSPPSGCRFHPRCPYAFKACRELQPELTQVRNEHTVSCHLID